LEGGLPRPVQLLFEGFDLGTSIGVANCPDRCYGTGPDAPASAQEDFTARYLDESLAPDWDLVLGEAF
jgi:hypothetical protein